MRRIQKAFLAIFVSSLAVISLNALAQTPELPDRMSAPKTREKTQPTQPSPEIPVADTQSRTPPSRNIPVPAPRPETENAAPAGQAEETPPSAPDAEDLKRDEPLPAAVPVPGKRPGEDDIAIPEEEPEPADPRSAVIPASIMPETEKACRARLTELGAEFEDRAARADPAGCSIPYPLVLKSLGKTVALEPEAEMNCAIAEASARFARDVVSPAASKEFGEELKSVSHASAYVCRPRNGTRKLSEHAFGNAFDIASFTLSKDTRVEVILRPEEKHARFLGAVRKAACGPFKTVLGPGSDADHATHLHFDLAPRRNGGTYCR